MKQIGEIDARVQGIPCQIKITSYFRQRPLGPRADSDMDCYGYSECEYEILDRHGYRAQWLEKKLTDADHALISELIDEYKEEQRHDI